MSSNSKIDVNYLVFDDDNDAQNQYITQVIIPGYTCNLIYINPKDFFLVDDNKFDNENFIKEIIDKTKGLNINLIVTDWNILAPSDGFNGFVGWDVIESVLVAKDKLKSRSFLIYSGDLKKATEYIIAKIKNDIANEDQELITSKEFISKILELKIKFCRRDENRFTEITTLLRGSNTISDIVLNSILSFEDNTIINTGNRNYDGKKISELVNNNEVDNNGLKFIREFIDLSIANYTELSH